MREGILLVSLLILTFTRLDYVSNSDILVVLPVFSTSHFTSFQPLFEELIGRGHNLTIISAAKLSKKFEQNYTHIDVSHLDAGTVGINFAEMRKQTRLQNVIFCNERLIEHTTKVMREFPIRRLLLSKDTKFDLVMIELFHMDVYAAFGNHFKAPVIALSAQALISFYTWTSHNPLLPSYMPNMYLPFTNKMSFVERFWNTFFTIYIGLYHQFVSLPRSQKIMEEWFPFEHVDKIPKLEDLMKNISLILVNYHFAFQYPVPFLPNVVQIAGLHITEPNPLPQDLQRFMDSAAEGVIYVSLGSLIRPNDVDSIGKTIIRVLQHLPQKVIFKWDPEILSSKPDNFLIRAWTPQTSILKHPNCRLFITHGGLHSLLESVNFSVPIIGVPFFTDQQHNIALVEHLGIGKKLNVNFNDNELFQAVQEVITNPVYYEKMKLQSSKFDDRMTSPLNAAVFWVEYVLRHKEDLRHLRSANADLLWYQYFLLDVFLVIVLAFLSILALFYYIVRRIISRFSRRSIISDFKYKIG